MKRLLRRRVESPTRSETQRSGEEGSASLLGLGLGVAAAMIITGGIAVTSTAMARMDVLDAADHASAAAADRLDEPAIYAGGVESGKLDPTAVRTEVARILSTTPRPKHVRSWSVTKVDVVGNQLSVDVKAVVEPAVVGSAMRVLGAPVVVTVHSGAQAHMPQAEE